MSVLRIEAGTHGAARKVDVETRHPALHLRLAVEGHFLRQDAVERAGTIAEMQQSVLPRTELIAGHPDLATAGVVDILGEPAERTIVVRRGLRLMGEIDHAVEATLLHPVESAHGRPGAFVVAGGELAGRADADTVGSSEARSEELALLPIRGNLQERPVVVADLVETPTTLTDGTSLDDVEIAGGVRLEVESELVEILGDHQIEVEGFVGVAFAVAIRVAQLPEAIAAGDIDLAVHDLEAERVIESGSKTTPSDLLQFIIDTRRDEDVAMEGTDDRAPIRQKVEGRREHRRLPGIGHG